MNRQSSIIIYYLNHHLNH